MLNLFRQRGLSSVVYGIILVGTIAAFVIGFGPSAGKRIAPISERCVARVRGRCIEPKDFLSAYRILMPSRSVQLSRKMNLKRVALDGLIERELLGDEATRLGISVTDDELTDQLYAGFVRVSVPAVNPGVANALLQELFQSYGRQGSVPQDVAVAVLSDSAIPVEFRDAKTKMFDMKTYERQVRNLSNRSTTEFREEQGRELLAAKMRDIVRDPVRVSDSEAWQEYDRRHSTATVTSIVVKEAFAARWALETKAADVAAWAKEHAPELDAALKQRMGDDAPKAGHFRQILVTLAYGASADEKAAALGKLSWAAARIKAGEPFAEVARDVSDDPASAGSGGDVGDKTDGSVGPFRAPPFKAVASGLKPGEMTSGAVETQFGYHLIARDDPSKSAEVESQVKRSLPRALMAKARATDAAKAVAGDIAGAMRAGKTAEQATTDAISPLRRSEKIDMLRVLLVPGTAADAGSGDVTGRTFDAATDPDRPQPATSSAFPRGGDPFPGLSPEGTTNVVAFAFSASPGDVLAAPVRTAEGFVVVQLKEQRRATRDEFGKDRSAFVEEMVRAKRAEALALYVKRLREQAKDAIKIDSSIIEESRPDGGAPTANDEEEL
jgi:peptidyl-prolyl cis-trans isomerase D